MYSPSHSCNLVQQHACKDAIPKWFYKLITWFIGYVRNSLKREAEFNLFLEYLEDLSYKLVKHCATRSHHQPIERVV